MSDEFKKEQRYIVLKLSDIEAAGLDSSDEDALRKICNSVALARARTLKSPMDCVVVESDWPESEIVWQMIEARCAGNPNIIAKLREERDALAATQLALQMLVEEIHAHDDQHRHACADLLGRINIDPAAILAARDARVRSEALRDESRILTESRNIMQKVDGDFVAGYRSALDDAIEGANNRADAIEKGGQS